MRILLVNPGADKAHKKENLGLAYIASSLEAAGHRAEIVDEIANQDVEEALDRVRPDLAGISFMTMFARRAYALADRIRAKRGIPVVLGGAHATALPEEAIEHADAVIRGEAELTLPRLLAAGRVEGIVEGEPPTELDELPLPARGKLNLDFYADARERIETLAMGLRTLGTITSRGCSYSCVFCVNSKRRAGLRVHSPERVLEEIHYLANRHHIESVAFFDELITVYPERFRTICEKIVAEGLDHLRWECQMHARSVKPELLKTMKRAGCVQVGIGFESGSQRILDRINKHSTVEDNLEAARRIHEAGLRLRGCFVIGMPGETREDIRKTQAFIKAARIDFSSVHFLTPFPGSSLYEQVADKIAASGISWEHFTAGDSGAFVCNDAMPAEEQRRLFEHIRAREAFKNYSWKDIVRQAIRRPAYALHILSHLRP